MSSSPPAADARRDLERAAGPAPASASPETARDRRPLGYVAWLLLAAVLVVLPPGWLARTLRGDEVPETLVTGLWLTKGAVAFTAALWHWLRGRYAPQGALLADPAIAPGYTPRWAMPVLLVAAFALRLPQLDAGLWFDEIQTQLTYVRLPWGTLLTTFDSTNQHLLFSVAARAVQGLAGESAATLRLPAVLFGVASLWAAFAFARRWLPARDAWWSTVLLAFAYHHVWFSQNARGYTGQLLGTLWSSALFLDLLRTRGDGSPPPRRVLFWYAVAVTVLLLAHVTGLVVVAAHGLCWLWQARRLPAGRARWAPFHALLFAGGMTAICYVHLVPQVLAAVGGSGKSAVAIAWQNPLWFLAETVRSLAAALPAGSIVLPAAALVGAFGVALAWRRDRVATALMLLPIILMLLVVLSTGHNIWPRFFFFAAGFLVQLAVHGGTGTLALLARRTTPTRTTTWDARIADGAFALATLAFLAVLPRAWGPKQDFAAAVSWVEARRQPGDTVVVTDLTAYPIQEWLRRDWLRVDDDGQLAAAESPAGRTWVLYTFPIRLAATFPALWARLERDYRPVHVLPGSVGGGEIVIMARPPLPASNR